MELQYYPGCTIKTSATNYETSAVAALQALGIKLNEMDDWNCCGVVHGLASDDMYHHIAPVRVLMHAEKEQEGGTIVTLCDMCYNTLSQTNHLVHKNANNLETLHHFMDCEEKFKGTVSVSHLLQVLRDNVGFDNIKRKVKNPLTGLNVFPYYGCMLLRPEEISIDNAEDPTIMADLMRALGAEVIDDPVKIECCGSHLTVNEPGIVYKRVEHIIARAKACGANAVVLSCPLCRYNLDTRQQEAPNITDPIPVFYYTQLMSLAFGVEESMLGLNQHRIDPLPLLNTIGNGTLVQKAASVAA